MLVALDDVLAGTRLVWAWEEGSWCVAEWWRLAEVRKAIRVVVALGWVGLTLALGRRS